MIIIKLLSIGCLLMLILSSACVEVTQIYRDPNCASIQNISENRTVEHHGMRMVGKTMMSYTDYETEYHAYLVCLNGSQYDDGWV